MQGNIYWIGFLIWLAIRLLIIGSTGFPIVMGSFVETLLGEFDPKECSGNFSVLDSMLIVTCSGKRARKVAPEITAKGYCSTKRMYYYGMKLHVLSFCNTGRLPNPEQIIFTPASANDLSLYKEAWSEIENRTFFGDKIYNDTAFFPKYEYQL